MVSYIPSIHLGYTAEEKLKPEWWNEAKQLFYYQSNNVSLLQGKKIREIDSYAEGNIDMRPFRKLFKTDPNIKDEVDLISDSNGEFNDNGTGLGYEPLPLIPIRENAARSLIENIPIEVAAEATDALAWEKKEKDIQFLKNKPMFENQLQDLSDRMNLGKVDLGSTKHTAIPFSSSPYGLDLNEADELQVFVGLLSGLSVEAAYETILQSYWDLKNCNIIKGLWIRDQIRYGVSCHRVYDSAMTGLPELDYLDPDSVKCPKSLYPDYRDNTQRLITESMTVIDMFNKFGDEIGTEEDLEKLISGNITGYCDCNRIQRQPSKNYDSFKVIIEYVEIKSIDWIGVIKANPKSKYSKFTTDENEVKQYGGKKLWAQNTYCAYWLKGTDKFFKITKLSGAYREEGQEQYQGFSSFIFKGAERSAVELSIPENKKAQIADIKMQHAILKAKKSGMYIDLKYLRNTLKGLKDDSDYSMKELIRLAFQENEFIGDSDGFDGQNEGQFQPFKEIVGGIRQDVVGYAEVINAAAQKISQFTGINEQLIGSASNPEGLVGMQKLLINGASNAISYINRAVENHCTSLFNQWGYSVKKAIERGGKPKEAITRLIGAKKVNILDALDDLPLHQLGIKVEVAQRELEREEYRVEIMRLKQMGVVNTVDDYILSAIKNPKDKMALLAVRTKLFERKMQQQRMEQNEQQQVLLQQAGKNKQAEVAMKGQSDKEKIVTQGQVSADILKLAAELGMTQSQVEGFIKKKLQDDRNQAQLDKNVKTLETKSSLENQQPYGG